MIFGSPSYGGSYKITIVCLSVRPSVSSTFFSGMAHQFFLTFGKGSRYLEYFKTRRDLFSEELHVSPDLGKKGFKMGPK